MLLQSATKKRPLGPGTHCVPDPNDHIQSVKLLTAKIPSVMPIIVETQAWYNIAMLHHHCERLRNCLKVKGCPLGMLVMPVYQWAQEH